MSSLKFSGRSGPQPEGNGEPAGNRQRNRQRNRLQNRQSRRCGGGSRAQNPGRGFTLLEALIAVAVLAGLTSASVLTWSGSVRRIQKSERLHKAAALLEQKMADLETQYKNTGRAVPEEGKGDFPEEPDWSWRFKARRIALPPASLWLTSRSIPQNEMSLSITESLRDILSKTATEVQLTVLSKKTGHSWTLAGLFVSYENAPLMIQSLLNQSKSGFQD